MEIHTPVMPQIIGRISTAATSNTSVRKNEISAEVSPSFSAVKKPEPNTAKPMNKKDSAKMRKPDTVSCISSLS